MQEFQQLHKQSIFSPLQADRLSREDKKKALESVISIKEKCDGRPEGRTCANGSKQREWISCAHTHV